MINKEEFQKMKPEERIKKLKQLEEKSKGEVLEIEKLIKETDNELRIERIAEENVPHPAAVDITRLFEPEGEHLERTVKKETSETSQNQNYLALAQVYKDYSKLKRAVSYAVSGGLSEEQKEMIDKIGERLQRFKYESASEEVANLVVASRAALHKLRRYAGLQ